MFMQYSMQFMMMMMMIRKVMFARSYS